MERILEHLGDTSLDCQERAGSIGSVRSRSLVPLLLNSRALDATSFLVLIVWLRVCWRLGKAYLLICFCLLTFFQPLLPLSWQVPMAPSVFWVQKWCLQKGLGVRPHSDQARHPCPWSVSAPWHWLCEWTCSRCSEQPGASHSVAVLQCRRALVELRWGLLGGHVVFPQMTTEHTCCPPVASGIS